MISYLQPLLRRPLFMLGGLVMLVANLPLHAQSTNVNKITLSTYPPTNTSVNGRIVGSYALSNIAETDVDGTLCAGYADTNPDYVLVLGSDFPSLGLEVNSGQDTTLLIQGPSDNIVRCGQDISRSNLDAQIVDRNWSAGTYSIWVGAHNQGERFSYTLTVTE